MLCERSDYTSYFQTVWFCLRFQFIQSLTYLEVTGSYRLCFLFEIQLTSPYWSSLPLPPVICFFGSESIVIT